MTEPEVNLRSFLEVIWKRRKLVIWVFFVTEVIAIIASLVMPKVYEASLTMMGNKPKYQMILDPKIQTLVSGEISIEGYRKLIRDRKLEEKVIQKLVTTDPSYASLNPDKLGGMIKIIAIPNTNLFEIKIEANTRKKAMDIADTWGHLFVESNENMDLQETIEAQKFITAQLTVTGNNLDKQEKELSQFNEKNKMELLKMEIEDKTKQIAQYEQDIIELGLSVTVKESELKQIEEELKNQTEKLVLSRSLTDEQALEQAAKEIFNKDTSKHKNVKFGTEILNPAYAGLKQKRSEANIDLSSWKAKLAYLKNNMEGLMQGFMALKKELAEQQLTQGKISRQISAINQTYMALSQKAEETRIAAATKPEFLKIVQDAYASETPIRPSKTKNVLLAGMAGLLLGILLAFFVKYLGPKEI